MWYSGPWEIFLCWFAAQVCPWGIRQAINWATREYGAPDIYITENGFRWPLNACPGGKTVVVYWRHSVLVGGWVGGWTKTRDCLSHVLLQRPPWEHWWSSEDLLLQALSQPGKFSSWNHFFFTIDNINQYIFWEHYLNYTLKTQGLYFKSRCWRQSKWTGSLWRATTPGASLTTLSEWEKRNILHDCDVKARVSA